MTRLGSNYGFTLIELVVVIAIASILTTIVMVTAGNGQAFDMKSAKLADALEYSANLCANGTPAKIRLDQSGWKIVDMSEQTLLSDEYGDGVKLVNVVVDGIVSKKEKVIIPFSAGGRNPSVKITLVEEDGQAHLITLDILGNTRIDKP